MNASYFNISDDSLVFVYKEQWFTGFAPCFDDGVYTLSCCKGKRGGGSMRETICKHVREDKEVWILSVAGKDISLSGHNTSGIPYTWKDLIYLTKAEEALTWEDYMSYIGKRKDAIYRIDDNRAVRIENPYHGEDDLPTDTGDISAPQIVRSSQYYVFREGASIPTGFENFLIDRGYKYHGLTGLDLKKLLAAVGADVLDGFTFPESLSRSNCGGCKK